MKIVNRGYVIVWSQVDFWKWAQQIDSDVEMLEFEDLEPNIYLITDDFFEIEPILEQYHKKIFATELSMISDDELDWPKDRNLELFLRWFRVELGSTVFDLEKNTLTSFDE